MKPAGSVTASVDVSVDPQTAFLIFTGDIDSWWERGPINFYDGGRATAMRFEPGVGGRYLEVYNDQTGDALEIGRITVWDLGHRIVWRHSLNDTEVEVRFEAIPNGTRVVLVQRLVPGGIRAQYNTGWHHILAWFGDWADQPDGKRTPHKDIPRIIPVLRYKDEGAAARWLIRVFGLRPRHGQHVTGLGELTLADSMVMIRGLQGPAQTFELYVYVDDLESHLANAAAGGATIIESIHKRGDRLYAAADLEGNRWTFAQARPTQRS